MNDALFKKLTSHSAFIALLTTLTACGGGGGTVDPNTDATATGPTTVAAAEVGYSAEQAPPPPDVGSVNGEPLPSKQEIAAASASSVPVEAAEEGSVQDEPSRVVALSVSATTASETAAPSAQFIFVSPAGNDAWSGSLQSPNANGTDGPVKSLLAAQALARAKLAAMSAGATRMPVKVRIGAGKYYLTAPLSFTEADSGTAAAPVAYEAITPGTVLISGGVPLVRSAAQTSTSQVSFDTPASAGTAWQGAGQLFVNDHRATVARQPNEGQYWFVKQATTLAGETTSDAGREAFTTSADALAWMQSLGASDSSRAVVNVMQSFAAGHHRISTATTPSGSVRVAPRAQSAFLKFGLSQRFFVENVAAALDAPGEWLWDSNGIRYIPAAGESAATLTAVMPVLEKLISIKGGTGTNQWVQNLWLSGLSFAHTRYLVPAGGFIDTQAGIDVGAAIEIDNAVGIVIDKCKVSDTSGYGVWFRRGVRDSRVTNSTFTDMGAGGLKFGQANQLTSDVVKTGANSAVGNTISDTGKIFPGSVGIWVGQGYDNLVANNAILNTSYTGISAGWSWGYSVTTSGRNKILNNVLINIGQGQLSDLGGIYTVGISPGTIISGNVVREVRSYPGYGPGGWGIYSDEGSSSVIIEDNVVIGTDSGGYQLNYGRNNIVRRNLFALGSKAEIRVARTDPLYTNLAFQDNTLIPSVRQPFDSFAEAPDVIFSGNQTSNRSAGTTLDLAKCGTGCSSGTALLTTGPEPRNVSISNVDAATATRISQIMAKVGPADFGVLVSTSGVPSAPVVVASALPVAAVAPPTPINLDIANTALGAQPKGFAFLPAGDTAAISIVSDGAAPAGRCLAFRDSGLFRYGYFPYAYTSLNHDKGISTAEFSLLIDAKSSIGYEWRDGGNPYKSGPALQISAAGVVVNGKIIAAAPAGQWLTFRITAPVTDPLGSWSLDVIDAAGTKKTFSNLKYASAGWTKLIWMGFMSNATTTSTACLGGMKVTSSIL